MMVAAGRSKEVAWMRAFEIENGKWKLELLLHSPQISNTQHTTIEIEDNVVSFTFGVHDTDLFNFMFFSIIVCRTVIFY